MDCVEVLRGSFQLAEPVLAGSAKELPVDADEKPCGDARVSLLESQLRLKSVCQHLHEARHHLELLRLQGGGLLDDPREGREPGAAQAGALGGLESPQRREDRLALPSARDRRDQSRLPRRDGVEAPLREELHRPVGYLLPRVQLLRLAQAHAPIVTELLQLQKTFSACNVLTLSDRKEIC